MRDGGCEVESDLGKNIEGKEGKGNVSNMVDFVSGLCALDGKAGRAVRGWGGRFSEKC